nr:MAG TPA: hypothetical protein [Caudoviricetes sp.]
MTRERRPGAFTENIPRTLRGMEKVYHDKMFLSREE